MYCLDHHHVSCLAAARCLPGGADPLPGHHAVSGALVPWQCSQATGLHTTVPTGEWRKCRFTQRALGREAECVFDGMSAEQLVEESRFLWWLLRGRDAQPTHHRVLFVCLCVCVSQPTVCLCCPLLWSHHRLSSLVGLLRGSSRRDTCSLNPGCS